MSQAHAWFRRVAVVALLLALAIAMQGFLSGCRTASGEHGRHAQGASEGRERKERAHSDEKTAKTHAARSGEEDEDDDDDDDKAGKTAAHKDKHGGDKDEDDDDDDRAEKKAGKGGQKKGGKAAEKEEDEDDDDDDDKDEAKADHPAKHATAAKGKTSAKSGGGFADAFPEAAADWASVGSNDYFILQPGYQLILEGKEGGKDLRLEITVLYETKTIDGVLTRVVEEKEIVGGKLIEDTRDYFAFSKKTRNVYYFGEDVDVYRDGKVVGHGGSWLSGVNGARYGLMMPGAPAVGYRHYQELAPGVGMDRAEIVSLTETMETPAGKFEKCLKVAESNPLEVGSHEYKIYAPGVGLLQDEDAKLVKYGFVK